MNRIITILVTIFILLLLYIWISHVWGSDKPRHPRQIIDATEDEVLGADDMTADTDTSSTLFTEVDPENENPVMEEEDSDDMVAEEEPIDVEPVVSEPVKTEPVKKQVVQEKKTTPARTDPAPKPVTNNPPATKTSQPITKTTQVPADADGKHLVIVGNFLQRLNATQRLQELQKAGFSDVEIVNFDLSEYHTVCAGRFDDVNEARRLVKKLKDYHKIDAYVRIGG